MWGLSHPRQESVREHQGHPVLGISSERGSGQRLGLGWKDDKDAKGRVGFESGRDHLGQGQQLSQAHGGFRVAGKVLFLDLRGIQGCLSYGNQLSFILVYVLFSIYVLFYSKKV